jgi:peroxiredoxin Q/BCP
MQFQAGLAAPSFETADIFGQPVNLSDYAGRTVLLSFFRNAACALCNLRVHELIQRYPDYRERGLEIIAVFESSLASIAQYVGRQDAPFAIVADPAAELYDLYAVEVSADKIAKTMGRPETERAVAEAAAHGFALTKEAGSNFERIPADFLIGPDGRILRAQYAEYVTDHLSFETIDELLPAAQAQV